MAGEEIIGVAADYVSTQNVESLRQAVTKKVLSYAKNNIKCHVCGSICKQMKLYESKIIYTMGTAEREPRKKKPGKKSVDPFAEDVGEPIPEPEQSTLSQKYLTPLEARLGSSIRIFEYF